MVGSRFDHPGSFPPIRVAFHSLVGLYACDRSVDIMLAVSQRVLAVILRNIPLDGVSVSLAFKFMTSTYASFITVTDTNGVDVLLYTLNRDVTPSTNVFDSIEAILKKGRWGKFFRHDSGLPKLWMGRNLRLGSKCVKFICHPEPQAGLVIQNENLIPETIGDS